MTLINAVKSGKPFKRKCELEHKWRTFHAGFLAYLHEEESDNVQTIPSIAKEDILSKDWEVKP